jgi:hypothetical protein
MAKNETAALGLTPNAAREKPDPTAKLDRNRSRGKSTREALLLGELRAAALILAPGGVVFVGPSDSAGWFRVERLGEEKARVTHVSEDTVAQTLLEEADFLAASPLGGVA